LSPLTVRDALTAWQFAPLVSVALAVAGGAYLVGAWRVGRRHPAGPWPRRRTLAFLIGLAVIAIAIQSSAGAYDDVLFSAHMVQHLLLIMAAPPLLVFGRPVILLLHATRNPVHTRVKRVLRSPAVAALTWPPVTVTVYATVVIVTHLTPLMNLVLASEAVHDAEHAAYLVTGYLYFLPVIGSEPLKWRVSGMGRFLLLLVVMPVDLAVGAALMSLPAVPFPAYLRTGRTWGPTPLADLHDGGLIMLAGSELIMTGLAILLAFDFVRSHDRAGDRLDADLAAYNAGLARLAPRAVPPGRDLENEGGDQQDRAEHGQPRTERQAKTDQGDASGKQHDRGWPGRDAQAPLERLAPPG
jgi:putative copper resistance protein D